MPKTYYNIKITEQKMAFALSTNFIREVKNLSPNFKRIA